MISKIVIGSDFTGAIRYIVDKGKNAEIIDSVGVRLKDNNSIVNSFNTQLELNPNISKPVLHISLNFSTQDLNIITNDKIIEIIHVYLNKMHISNTQYIAVRHYDKDHPHIHLCINRIDNNGKLISNKNDRYRSINICREITIVNGLYYASGKEKVKINRLKEPDRSRYEIYYSLKDLIPQSANWQELQSNLQQQDIEYKFKYKGISDTIQGVIFSKNGFSFNGSSVDRNFSFSKIDFQLTQNIKEYDTNIFLRKDRSASSVEQKTIQETTKFSESFPIGYSSSNYENEVDLNPRKKKKKNTKLNI